MITISLPSQTQYYNLHTLSGYDPGSVVLVTNMTTDPLFIVQAATQPVTDANAFIFLIPSQ